MPVLENARWEFFAQGVARGETETSAYEKAGYVRNSGNASRLRSNELVDARIREIMQGGAERNDITVDRVLEELRRIALADPRKLLDPETGELKPLHELDDDTAATLAGIDVTETVVESAAASKTEVRRILRVKQWDKLAALEKCCRYLGIAKEQVERNTKVEIVTPTDWLADCNDDGDYDGDEGENGDD